jgi:uncharacterized damage-inducible protein DinB
MDERAETLAARFEQVNQELIDVIEECSEEKWRSECAAEGWSVGVTAHHVALDTPLSAAMVRAIASGQPFPPPTAEGTDKANAQHAQEHADCTKQETLDLLRREVPIAAGVLRGFSDEQLGRTAEVLAGAQHLSTEHVIQGFLIAHVSEHLGSIRAAL